MSAIDKLSIPPTIPSSENDNTSETRILKTIETRSTTITDGTAVLNNGLLSGLNYPISGNSAATKEYVDDVATNTNVTASSPQFSVQYANITGTWTTYTQNTPPLVSVTWSTELDLFVASGSDSGNGVISRSSDGQTWVSGTTTSNTTNLSSITWSRELGLFVAVDSSAGVVVRSTDGISWLSSSAASSIAWNSITWSPELTLFCAVALASTTNSIMTSPDGINWTIRTSPFNNQLSAVTWSPELTLFVAVAFDGSGNQVIISSNGITWTSSSTPLDRQWLDIAWAPEISTFCSTSNVDRVMTSSDGITWTTYDVGPFNENPGIVWSSELKLFVAVTRGALERVLLSSDGIDWETQVTPLQSSSAVTWSPNLRVFCSVGDSILAEGEAMLGVVSRNFTSESDFFYSLGSSTGGILTVPSLTDGVSTLTGGILSDLNDPVNNQDAATKNYVDSINTIVRTTINTNDNITYTASQMIYGLITRTSVTTTVVDLTATAADLVANISTVVVGSKIPFSVKNESTDDNAIIFIAPNLGVTINNNNEQTIALHNNYQVNIELIVTNITSGSEAVTMLVLNNVYLDNGDRLMTDGINYQTQMKERFLTQRLNVTSDYIFRLDETAITANSNYTYLVADVLRTLVRRGGALTEDRTDTLPEPASFSSIATGITFVVQNIDPTYNIRINASSSWTNPSIPGSETDSSRLIPAGQTGVFVLNPVDTIYYTVSIN